MISVVVLAGDVPSIRSSAGSRPGTMFAQVVLGGQHARRLNLGQSDPGGMVSPLRPTTHRATARARASDGHHVSMNSLPFALRPSTHQPT
jgi:hypothetical protein